jgi:hypothetical protein
MWSRGAAGDPSVCQWHLDTVCPCEHFDQRDPWQQRLLLPFETVAAPVALGQHGMGSSSRTLRTYFHATHLGMAEQARQLSP